jgi:hypothetical protein
MLLEILDNPITKADTEFEIFWMTLIAHAEFEFRNNVTTYLG